VYCKQGFFEHLTSKAYQCAASTYATIFRPVCLPRTGSTTASIISLLSTVFNLLSTEPYVIVLSLDFSKAFNIWRVWRATLLQKASRASPSTNSNSISNPYSKPRSLFQTSWWGTSAIAPSTTQLAMHTVHYIPHRCASRQDPARFIYQSISLD